VQTVEECDASCQVGGSLEKLGKAPSSTDSILRSSSLNNLDLAQGMETLGQGLSLTYDAVKDLISGIVSTYKGLAPPPTAADECGDEGKEAFEDKQARAEDEGCLGYQDEDEAESVVGIDALLLYGAEE
jgi:hypothetical protein